MRRILLAAAACLGATAAHAQIITTPNLPSVITPATGDYLTLAQPCATTFSGYCSRKLTIGQIASFIPSVSVNQQIITNALGYTPVNPSSLGSAAFQNVGYFDPAGAATSAQSAAVAMSAQRSANLSDLISASTARINLGLGSAATQATSYFDLAGAAAAVQAADQAFSSNAANLTSGLIPTARFPVVQLSPGQYGSATNAPVITVDAYGRVTSISTAPITGGGGGGTATTDASQLTAGTLNAARLPGQSGDAVASSGSNVVTFSGTQASRINLGFAFVSSAVSAPAAIPTGSSIYVIVPLTGATIGDFAQCSLSVDQQGLILSGYVPSAGNVRCTYTNLTGGSVALASHTVYAQAERHS